MTDSGYIRLVQSQIADKKAELEGLEELLDEENSDESKRYSREQEIRRLKAEIHNLEVQL
jgi:hypothetical protein